MIQIALTGGGGTVSAANVADCLPPVIQLAPPNGAAAATPTSTPGADGLPLVIQIAPPNGAVPVNVAAQNAPPACPPNLPAAGDGPTPATQIALPGPADPAATEFTSRWKLPGAALRTAALFLLALVAAIEHRRRVWLEGAGPGRGAGGQRGAGAGVLRVAASVWKRRRWDAWPALQTLRAA